MKKIIVMILLSAASAVAAVSDGESVRQSFGTNGSTTTFTFSFKCNSADDVLVYSPVIATGLPIEPLTVDTDYTIAPTNGSYLNGGVVTISPALEDTVALRIVRRIKQSQETAQGAITPTSIVAALDKATRQIQDAEDRKNRSLHIPDSDSVAFDMTIPNAIDRASKNLGFDSGGNVTITDSSGTFSAITAVWDDVITKSPWVDVRAYGALGNGVADDSSAINAAGTAINNAGGGTMFFPEGTYIIDAAITVYDNMRVTGEAGAILKTKDDSDDNILHLADRSNVIIDHLTFDGNFVNETGFSNDGTKWNCIYALKGTDIRVDSCTMYNVMGRGINAHGTKESRFTNNHITTTFNTDGSEENGGIQLHFYSTTVNVIPTGNVIANNYIEGFETGGIHLRGAHKNFVIANTVYNCSDASGRPAIILYDGDDDDGAVDNIVANNVIDTAVAGINIVKLTVGPQRNIISENTFQNISDIAINVTGSNNIISSNVMVDSISIGIKINADDENVVRGNIITTTGAGGSIGIDVRDASERTLITNNIVTGCESAIVVRGGDNSIINNNMLDSNIVNDIKVTGGNYLTIIGNSISNISGGIDIASGTFGHRIHSNMGVADQQTAGQTNNYVTYDGEIVVYEGNLVINN